MAGSISRNRPGSARRARENDPLKRTDLMATSSAEVDLSAFVDAIATLQTVDLHGLQRRLNVQNSVSDDLKNGQDGKESRIGYDEKRDIEMKYLDLKKKYAELDAAQNELKAGISKQLEEKEKLNNELTNIRAELNMKDLASSEQESEILRLKVLVESADKDMKSLNQRMNECKNELKSKERSLQEMQKAMEEVKRAKDEELTRLKQQMGKQISEGNPNITDLGDYNRPSKLGEIYSELYNNEWTNAFEDLTKTVLVDDRKAIELLLKILWESSKHASDLSQSNMKTIEKLISGSSEEPTPDCKRLLREARKHVDIKKAEYHLQTFVEKLARWDEWTYKGTEKVEVYSRKCFQLCWLMSIQDPPVILYNDLQRGASFDTNMYKYYTHSGDTFDYVVWPALLLHNNGPLLAKGVAQPSPGPGRKYVSTFGKPPRKDNKSFDGTSNEKECELSSGSDRKDKTPYEHQTRDDDASLSTSGLSPKETRTYSEDGGKYNVYAPETITPKDAQVTDLRQLYQPHVFQSSHARERFKRFCEQVSTVKEQHLRDIYGTDYDHYYTLYINQKYGHYKFI